MQTEIQSPNPRSDLRFEAWKPVNVKRDMGVNMTDLYREACKPVLKLYFMAHEFISEFGLWIISSFCFISGLEGVTS
jgi:hypothetical protein